MANEMVPCSGSSASRSRLGVRCLTRSAPATTALAHLPLLRSGRMSSAAPRSADRRADRVGHQRSDQHPVIAFGRARREGAGTTAARGPRTCSGRRALTGRRARAHALCWHGSARSRRSKPVGQGWPARHSPTRCWPRPRRLRREPELATQPERTEPAEPRRTEPPEPELATQPGPAEPAEPEPERPEPEQQPEREQPEREQPEPEEQPEPAELAEPE